MSGIRVIAGEARGRWLKSPAFALGVRPMLARMKKSLFDILRQRLPGSRFLDLYAGTGSVGIEALSRGATEVVFVEKDPRMIRLIRANLERLGWSARAQVYPADATRDMAWLGSFDLIFMGPPYVGEKKQPLALTSRTLQRVARTQLLRPEGLLIAQHHAKERLEAESWELIRQESYGDSRFSFFRCCQRLTHDPSL